MVLGSIMVTDLGNGTAQVERNGMLGPRSQILPVTKAAVDAWMSNRTLVQDAFPDLTDDQREFLLTGMTVEDWTAAFGEEEDEAAGA